MYHQASQNDTELDDISSSRQNLRADFAPSTRSISTYRSSINHFRGSSVSSIGSALVSNTALDESSNDPKLPGKSVFD